MVQNTWLWQEVLLCLCHTALLMALRDQNCPVSCSEERQGWHPSPGRWCTQHIPPTSPNGAPAPSCAHPLYIVLLCSPPVSCFTVVVPCVLFTVLTPCILFYCGHSLYIVLLWPFPVYCFLCFTQPTHPYCQIIFIRTCDGLVITWLTPTIKRQILRIC